METLTTFAATPLDARHAVGWVLRIAGSLSALHRRGGVHGRLSADAVVAASGSCDADALLAPAVDLADALPYHPAARLRGRPPCADDDVWALGVLLYRLLTATLPFAGATGDAVLERQRAAPPPPLAVFDVGDDELQHVLDRLFGEDGPDRITKLDQLRGALLAWDAELAALTPLAVAAPGELVAVVTPRDIDDDDSEEEMATAIWHTDDPEIAATLARLREHHRGDAPGAPAPGETSSGRVPHAAARRDGAARRGPPGDAARPGARAIGHRAVDQPAGAEPTGTAERAGAPRADGTTARSEPSGPRAVHERARPAASDPAAGAPAPAGGERAPTRESERAGGARAPSAGRPSADAPAKDGRPRAGGLHAHAGGPDPAAKDGPRSGGAGAPATMGARPAAADGIAQGAAAAAPAALGDDLGARAPTSDARGGGATGPARDPAAAGQTPRRLVISVAAFCVVAGAAAAFMSLGASDAAPEANAPVHEAPATTSPHAPPATPAEATGAPRRAITDTEGDRAPRPAATAAVSPPPEPPERAPSARPAGDPPNRVEDAAGRHDAPSAGDAPVTATSSGGSVNACLAPLFPEGTFRGEPAGLEALCAIDDPVRGAAEIRTRIVIAGRGRGVTEGMREWAELGWYGMAAFAVARGHCCPGAGPLAAPATPQGCPIDERITALVGAASRGDEATAEAAVEGYREAIGCLFRGGNATLFGQSSPPTSAERGVFQRVLGRALTLRR